MDPETMFDAIANVGIKDGRIATISNEPLTGADIIDATGLEAMQDRDRMHVGKIADITLFDPEMVTDNSGNKVGEHGIPTAGIPHVIVKRTGVVRDIEVLQVSLGRSIRFPVEPTGRFEPIGVGSWLIERTIGLNPDLAAIHADDDSGAGNVLHGDHWSGHSCPR